MNTTFAISHYHNIIPCIGASDVGMATTNLSEGSDTSLDDVL